MNIFNYNKTNLVTLLLISFSFSCINDDDNGGQAANFNSSFKLNHPVEDEFEAIGEFNSLPSGIDDLHVSSFEFTDNLNTVESTFLIAINRFDEAVWEPSNGLYIMRDSFLAGGEAGNFGAGATWWDDSRQATIYSELDRGFIRIRNVTDTQISGDFEFTILAPQSGEALEVVQGRFTVERR